MSVKDLSKAWDEAARRALETTQEDELAAKQLSATAGLRVRSGLSAGGAWGYSDSQGCSDQCTRVC